ncbi:uncharacterized protein LOC120065352 isoform X4 [Salvelinus namaycush]|uniref:Uncharacterized protein LOC120065352 isoform X4 n=1 Tax=Salvelinus namaycush TaxID=8040 RepID=A0A8U1H6G6_SALNM|nr:uncharacterized protein LOC120065352 isoform X4 [Salvelinus namaycush]
MPGSTFKKCCACGGDIRVARRKCDLCGAAQQLKKKLESQKDHYNDNWARNTLKGNNVAKVLNTAHLLIHKLEKLGMVPLILVGRPNNPSIGWSDVLCPQGFKDQQAKTVEEIKLIFDTAMKGFSKREITNSGCRGKNGIGVPGRNFPFKGGDRSSTKAAGFGFQTRQKVTYCRLPAAHSPCP